ncbi:ABC transporter permease [Gloeobacter kilaueensis]|uniref:Macrolide transporter ATP-binding /permease protein n=1 Tax=Gloeobacter kilaueensis (strain ATCC BAA-2537 / CCAP 1431/1 / ULC 316 / JS1) TaxID=1183438 RepID=U5QSA7_GLOK1|nr:ABC transporter permease [Gloeobacter kilaueensis]AGY60600.1 macrolide transporter ATP-binding /permease protein [Gloeobacter kilaueensis JS1]
MRVVDRLYGLFLRLYPSEFQQEYADEMQQVFRQAYREQREDSGGRAALWCAATFGDLVMTAIKEQLQVLQQDLRYGWRMLIKNPGFTAVAVLTLALGIGANTAIFSVVNAVLLRTLPYPEPEQLVQVFESQLQQGLEKGAVSPPNYLDWRQQNRVFTNIAVYNTDQFSFKSGSQPERLNGAFISADFFKTLGVRPLLGRDLSPEEEKTGHDRVVLLSYRLWQERFGGNPAVLGRVITLQARPYTVIGVLPPGFAFPRDKTEIWVPLAFGEAKMQERDSHFLNGIARLKPGISLAQASAQMDVVSAALARQYPDSNTNRKALLVPLYEQLVGKIRPALLLLLAAVAAVLLIACANVANLLLSRAVSRQKEIAVRTALGASRARILRQLLTESILLALLGALLGLGFALLGLKMLVATIPRSLPRIDQIALDGPVLVFTLAVAVLSAVLFGLAPALQVSKTDFNEALKDGGRGATSSRERNRVRDLLVVSEVALALMLLVSAALLTQSFLNLQNVKPGFRPEQVVTATLSLPLARYPEERQQITFFDRLIERVQTLPGVESVSVVNTLPLGGSDSSVTLLVEGQSRPKPGQEPLSGYLAVGPEYLRTMGIVLLRGRPLSPLDNAQTPKVALINETMARRFWPHSDPIGKRFSTDMPVPKADSWITVVGIVQDTRFLGLNQAIRPEMYLPYRQAAWPYMSLVVRTTNSDPATLAATLRAQVQAIDPDQALGTIKTMERVVADSIEQQRFNVLLLVSFAVVALILASIGIYSVMAYSVTQRTHEIGVRLALGAPQGKILALVVTQGMLLVLSGILVGLGAAVVLARALSSLLFGVSAFDLPTFAAVSVLILAVALSACYLPARRATRVDPMVALRYE